MAKCLAKLSFHLLRENPLFLRSDSSTSNKLGALEWYKFVHGHLGWRLVTCIWFHAAVIHFLLHMFNLIYIGIRLQKKFRFVTVVVIYMSGFCGSILSSIFLQHNFSVGASSALFGLLGAMSSELLLANIRTIYKAAALLVSNVVVIIHFANIGAFSEEDSAS
ncbi:hypothetical protein FNV43_RR09216 [Rhamnella rubrinervis]|uniref:RHOMBOID-like protein n=1 Tax=Rhamnella rubrinervis TaxID=2594499 RepID=A0A8K0HAD9_9ROSA|nr:hypothetical protein FNV43_RR09216 [Rhamnella rubrinervis]